jgi:hypothetical protein
MVVGGLEERRGKEKMVEKGKGGKREAEIEELPSFIYFLSINFRRKCLKFRL